MFSFEVSTNIFLVVGKGTMRTKPRMHYFPLKVFFFSFFYGAFSFDSTNQQILDKISLSKIIAVSF